MIIKAIEIFLSLAWQQPDKHLPRQYRQTRISLMTAYEVAASWYSNQRSKTNGN